MPPSNTDSPQARTQTDPQRPAFQYDPAQRRALAALQDIREQLLARPPKPLRRRWPPVTGLYLWGGVGRGKTHLMDSFYDSLPFSRKRRTHFHRFMESVHTARKRYRNRRDPLRLIARELAHDRVLCFDEFYVSDIADAMILGRLTAALFARGVTLIATSNTPPEQLYAGGLQRERFLPAIERIARYCRVLEVDGGTDYRLRMLESAEIYHHPLDAAAEDNLAATFREIGGRGIVAGATLPIHGRAIATRYLADEAVWFDFDTLCAGAYSAADYGEIARCFHTVLLSGVPVMDADSDDHARRFVNLVDEFYDRGIKLIVSAAAAPEALYRGNRLAFEFRRTASRLREMATRDYLARPHLP